MREKLVHTIPEIGAWWLSFETRKRERERVY